MEYWRTKLLLAIAIVTVGWVSLWSQSPATSISTPGDEKLQVISTTTNGIQQLVIVDSRNQSLAVYQIDPANGKIQLKSVRNLAWDLAMEQFNGLAPLPSELRQVRP